MAELPPLLDWKAARERLNAIFPAGTLHRGYVVRDMAAKTIFTMLYIGAVEGEDVWLRPVQVVRMTDARAAKADVQDRIAFRAIPHRTKGAWYADNSREPIRDETLRQGLIPLGAVIERSGIAPTSSAGRYALTRSFAELFDPQAEGADLKTRIAEWQSENLSRPALARVELLRETSTTRTGKVPVTFPDGSSRHMSPGKSSVISKHVIEEFAIRFFHHPVVLWLSESGNKVTARDDQLASRLHLQIRQEKILPDIILVDLLPEGHPLGPVLFVFVEAVATEGAITQQRRAALLEIIVEAGYDPGNAAFVSAFLDRNSAEFRRSVSVLSWDSFVWFVSEPNELIALSQSLPLSKLPLADTLAM